MPAGWSPVPAQPVDSGLISFTITSHLTVRPPFARWSRDRRAQLTQPSAPWLSVWGRRFPEPVEAD